MLVELESLRSRLLYGYVYGETGAGKTTLLATLCPDKTGLGIVSAEKGGPQVLLSLGFKGKMVFLINEPASKDSNFDPFERAIQGVHTFAARSDITAIGVDGLTLLAGMAINHWSSDGTEKGMGYDGWGAVLGGYRRLEAACRYAFEARKKSVVSTAWEVGPVEAEDPFTKAPYIKAQGRHYIYGKGQIWSPGPCDFLARLTSKFVKEGGKEVWKGQLQVRQSAEWLAKTRFKNLPNPCPADFQKILDLVSKESSPSDKVPPGKTPAVAAPAPMKVAAQPKK